MERVRLVNEAIGKGRLDPLAEQRATSELRGIVLELGRAAQEQAAQNTHFQRTFLEHEAAYVEVTKTNKDTQEAMKAAQREMQARTNTFLELLTLFKHGSIEQATPRAKRAIRRLSEDTFQRRL